MKSRTILLIGIVSVVSLFSSCQVKEEKKKTSESWTYQYNDNGCKTGTHKFSNKNDYCSALVNEELNNGCAYDIRMKVHKSTCES